MDNVKLTFTTIDNTEIDLTVYNAVVDYNSLDITTEFGKGEKTLTFDVYFAEINSSIKRAFNSIIYKVKLTVGDRVVWAGVKGDVLPVFDFEKNKLTISFAGYYILTEKRWLGKLWITNEFASRLFTPENRKANADQKRTTKEDDGLDTTLRMLTKDAELVHGTEYNYKQYKDPNGNAIKSIQTTYLMRSGEGVGVSIINTASSSLIVKTDATDTGDQKTQVTYNLPETDITGIDTSRLDIRMLASDAYAKLYEYGDGLVLGDGVLKYISLGENAFVLPFRKNFVNKLINSVTLKLNCINNNSMVAAIYDDGFNKVGGGNFDNTIVVTPQPGPVDYTFTKAGGLNIGNASGENLMYYLVLRTTDTLESTFTTVGQLTATNPPNTTYLVNGFRSQAVFGGAFPSMPGSFTISSSELVIKRWVALEFELIAGTISEYDNNDTATMRNTIIKTKYTSTHDNYLTPSYTPKEIIEDIVKTSLTEYEWDASLIASGINDDLPFDLWGAYQPELLSDLIRKVMDVYTAGRLFANVWAYDNFAIPRLKIEKQVDGLPSDLSNVYNINVYNKSVQINIKNVKDIRNYIHVTFKDVNGVEQVITPADYPQLKNDESITIFGEQHFPYNAGEVTEAVAVKMGQGIASYFAFTRPTGSIIISDASAIVSVLNTKMSPALHDIKAGYHVILDEFVDDLGNIDPVYQIMSTEYNFGSRVLKLNFDLASILQNYFKRFEARK